jgi:hypothetical protein
MREICRSCSPSPEITVPSLMLILSDSTSPCARDHASVGFINSMLNDEEPTPIFHLNGAEMQSQMNEYVAASNSQPLPCTISEIIKNSVHRHEIGRHDESGMQQTSRTPSMESNQRDFVEELNIETNLSPSFEYFSSIDAMYRSGSFDDIILSTDVQAVLPSPNHLRPDILSLWEEVASQLVEPVASPHRPLREPTHLAHRVPSAERMPPRKRFHGHAWDRLSSALLGVPRSPQPAPSTPRRAPACGLADSPPPCMARAWPGSESVAAGRPAPRPLAPGGGGGT